MQIELRSVHKRYGDVDVVADLSLLLPAGQVTALLGPSGCGKTTTLRMIAGLERCTGGSICIGDRVVDDAAAGVFVPPEERGLGMVFQSYALWPHKTVLENVAYPLTLRRQGKSAAVVVEQALKALQRVRLQDLAQRAPHQLSGGQQQRVAVARALVGDGDRAPPVLLLDEPLANLDARLREDMRAELAAIARSSGATVVAVTHDQQEAFALADAVVVLERGRLAQRGSPEEIYLHPVSPFVGSFGGPMAFLEGTAAGSVVDVAGWSMPAARISGALLGRVQLGVRPEWMVPGEAGVDVVVVQTLFLGREHEVSVTSMVGGVKLGLRVPSTSPAPAVGARLKLDLSRACAFPAPL